MRIHHRRRGGYQKKEELVTFKSNEAILAPEVFVIDDEGQSLGTMSTSQALSLAQERGFDLVEVSPPFDHGDITSILASNIVFEYLSLLAIK